MQTTWTKFSTKFVILLLLCSLVFFGVEQYKRYKVRASLDVQINSLKAEASSVEEKNKDLEDSLKYLSSVGATERLAKQQMNLERTGEIPVVFLPAEEKVVTTGSSPTLHWRAWWEYLFK